MKACTPSCATSSIMLQAIVCAGHLVGGLDAGLDLPVEQLLAHRDRDARLGDDGCSQRVDFGIELLGRQRHD